jgi:hypothetical protein
MEYGLLKVESNAKTSVRWRCFLAAFTGALGFAALSFCAIPKSRAMLLAAGSDFEWLEVRAGTWNAAADAIIARLKEHGVERGQIVSIDAHNNGPDEQAIFSAHFSKSWQSKGALDIVYTAQNTADYGWLTFYNNAASGVDTTDLIGITASCNTGGRGVQYSFSYAPAAANNVVSNLEWVESRSGSWNGGASSIISKLKSAGVQRGQIVSIDAHNNGPNGDAIFSAFYDKRLPGFGELNINYHAQNTNYGWRTFYNTASGQATANVFGITSSVNENGSAVTYVFEYE